MIPTFFNGMIAILLANWALNELPHAAGLLGNRYDEPATPGQLSYIAALCQQLKITTPYEEQVRTFGEAGRLIRELEAEREHRKGLKGGNPTIRVDTNEEVSQDRVSGVAIAWIGSKDVGSLHYDFMIGGTGELSFMQVDEEHRGLGVGRKMYGAVEDLARSFGIKKLTGEVGIPEYGDIERAEKFWKEMGFTVTDDHAEKQLEGRNPLLPTGVWYESPKIEAEVKSVPGLLEYIGSSLGELGQKYGTRPKTIGFAKIEDLAIHVWSDIIFNVVFVDLWLMDEAKTRQVLKYLVPHEFGHYMMAVEHVKIPLPRGPKWRKARKEWSENYADEFAGRESGMTREQANTLAGELGIEWEHKEVESGNPDTARSDGFRLERTTVDKVVDDLERTWHRIESDMSIRMQTALGILKETMGYFYEEPCVVAWEDSSLVGMAVYETIYDKDLGIKETHLKQLASFSYEPGIGKALVEEAIKIGQEEDSDIVGASYGPGNRGFYEKLGFVQNTYYPEEPTLMMYKLKGGNPDTAVGTCYPDAWRYLIKEEEGFLVHGSVQLSAEGPRVNHAWVELPTGYIWEPQTGQYFTIEGFKIFQPIEKIRYTDEQAAIMLARTGKHGPWTEEEGAQWL